MRILFVLTVLIVAACSGGGTVVTDAPDAASPAEAPTVTDPPLDDFEGAGVITFGRSYNEDTLLIDEPKTKFKRNVKKIAWSASFIEPAGSTTITILLAKVSKNGAETLIDSSDTEISNPEFDLLANEGDLAGIVDNKAGKYVLRYLREDTLLAEGTFELTAK